MTNVLIVMSFLHLQPFIRMDSQLSHELIDVDVRLLLVKPLLGASGASLLVHTHFFNYLAYL